MSVKKTQQVGMLKVNDNGREEIILGNPKNPDPKYAYTVQIRILDANDNVIVTKTNPKITLWDPKKGPAWLKKNLTVDLVDFVPTKQDQ